MRTVVTVLLVALVASAAPAAAHRVRIVCDGPCKVPIRLAVGARRRLAVPAVDVDLVLRCRSGGGQ